MLRRSRVPRSQSSSGHHHADLLGSVSQIGHILGDDLPADTESVFAPAVLLRIEHVGELGPVRVNFAFVPAQHLARPDQLNYPRWGVILTIRDIDLSEGNSPGRLAAIQRGVVADREPVLPYREAFPHRKLTAHSIDHGRRDDYDPPQPQESFPAVRRR